MTAGSRIPTDPAPNYVISESWFSDVALHRRGDQFVHESSYLMLWSTSALFAIAIGICFIPWEERVLIGSGLKVKYFGAAIFVWGGICLLGGYWFRNAFGLVITVKLDGGWLTIRCEGRMTTLSLDDVLGAQICRGQPMAIRRHEGRIGYQCNLVYRTASGELARQCLYSHINKSACSHLAEQYRDQLGFSVFDHTECNS